MVAFLMGVVIFCSLLLCLLLFFQNSKKNGERGAFMGSSAEQLIGVQSAADLLEKISWVLIAIIFGLSLQISYLLKQNDDLLLLSANIRSASEQPIVNN